MHIRAHYVRKGGHYHIRVFTGRSSEVTHALSGTLVLTLDELDGFKLTTNWTWINEDKVRELLEPNTYDLAVLCEVTNCKNKATHTWSGHPTCDACATPNRKNSLKKINRTSRDLNNGYGPGGSREP